jgi:hypothetical protein
MSGRAGYGIRLDSARDVVEARSTLRSTGL